MCFTHINSTVTASMICQVCSGIIPGSQYNADSGITQWAVTGTVPGDFFSPDVWYLVEQAFPKAMHYIRICIAAHPHVTGFADKFSTPNILQYIVRCWSWTQADCIV